MSTSGSAKVLRQCDSPGAILDALARKAMQTADEMNGAERVEVELTLDFESGQPEIRDFRIECIRRSVSASSTETKAKRRSSKAEKSDTSNQTSSKSSLKKAKTPDKVTLNGLANVDGSKRITKKNKAMDLDIVTLNGLQGSEMEFTKRDLQKTKSISKKFYEPDIVTFEGFRQVDKNFKPGSIYTTMNPENEVEFETENAQDTSDLFPQATIHYVKNEK
ncbi:hypothetical protein L596_024120 [Steinernema carpocapsae]|uniref:Uncharacterized protein n=1 Tax=Steinernema carpocapsae TaxID=34508 RepID=A0A4U5MFS2_STECR|nr:hypothetical protein L596_024120 [Steinernema carpocapsae]